MPTYDFKNLDVWKRAMELVVLVYTAIDKLPSTEKFGLSGQMRRAAVSVPSNIAEGQKRASRKEAVQFTYIALGSLAELETQLLITKKLYELDIEVALKRM